MITESLDTDRELEQNLNAIDDMTGELHPDHVKVAVDPNEELEFLSANEAETQSDLDNCDSQSGIDSESEVEFNPRSLTDDWGDCDDQFVHLQGNPAFERFIQKRVSQELDAKQQKKNSMDRRIVTPITNRQSKIG